MPPLDAAAASEQVRLRVALAAVLGIDASADEERFESALLEAHRALHPNDADAAAMGELARADLEVKRATVYQLIADHGLRRARRERAALDGRAAQNPPPAAAPRGGEPIDFVEWSHDRRARAVEHRVAIVRALGIDDPEPELVDEGRIGREQSRLFNLNPEQLGPGARLDRALALARVDYHVAQIECLEHEQLVELRARDVETHTERSN